MNQRRQLLFGMYLDALDMDEVIERCHAALVTRTRLLLGVLNAAKIVSLHKDRQLRNSLMECDLLLADGQSVVWASKLLGRPLPERVAGIDIFERLLTMAHEEGRSIALLGAKPDVLRKLQIVIGARFPGLRIACSEHGYYKPEEAADVAARIRKSGADMLFIGMTSPKKEIFLGTYGATLDVPIQHGVGGSFDIMAGLTKRAPMIWQKTGMEWAYRVFQEPGRLWWRYLSTNTSFVQMTAMEFIHPARAFTRDGAREAPKTGLRNENKRLGERSR
ncbi:N-acetylglucosaminyldiphosphoundecaprenol N-acetyl-beta-D-mannosaminyltransferase [Pararhizobium capsulatum DSM 1112]|uniref:N-acetylglucosaminyldiphosphoundecaprenol N-acetyl-beta-D-mannosaminyltransferase n=1 Tax=Pararhizobium capsulatum DSM 1112 TaxID=1121113 RepID=A0ABU0BX01_9HYPH|nr:WecB/TagA/CpsF family glycosyltransferase [Pararhizobium capsulatum]MDQ0322176.1 N-acetylglucosaminyldiphosphoundecaprenol N-acetyl-beta-D-mannosaminyltransferase [Pararhizobium capsulatum DSM 1112]